MRLRKGHHLFDRTPSSTSKRRHEDDRAKFQQLHLECTLNSNDSLVNDPGHMSNGTNRSSLKRKLKSHNAFSGFSHKKKQHSSTKKNYSILYSSRGDRTKKSFDDDSIMVD
mmetsp:Transcript_4502/g.6767  ORF Transcript_4502/g.6767 Transcript_4502/m.6767 type:complete len:111 (+) Transcript_4502:64-396(+)